MVDLEKDGYAGPIVIEKWTILSDKIFVVLMNTVKVRDDLIGYVSVGEILSQK